MKTQENFYYMYIKYQKHNNEYSLGLERAKAIEENIKLRKLPWIYSN